MPSKIIIAHNDDAFLADLHAAFRAAGLDASGLTNSMAALKVLGRAEKVEALVTSLVFPEGTPNGVALARMARYRKSTIKFVFLTTDPDLAVHAEGLGPVLLMPVTGDEVVKAVRIVLAGGAWGARKGQKSEESIERPDVSALAPTGRVNPRLGP